jgi:predicted permease
MILRRLAATWRLLRGRNRMESEMDDELRFHIDAYAARLERSGVSRAEAQRRARIEFGSLDTAKDDCRRAVWLRLQDDLRQDLRHAFRVIRRKPGLAAAAVISLALGIGANVAIFSLLRALLLESLPVEAPAGLVLLQEGERNSFAYPAYDRLRRGSRLLSVLGVSRLFERPSQIEERGERAAAFVQMVSEDYFDVLGVRPWRGRAFVSGEATAVISDSYWRRRYAGDPLALGASFRYLGREFTIAGIAPPEFRGTDLDLPTEIWVPVEQALAPGDETRLRGRLFRVMGRLRPGATPARAEAEATAALETRVSLRSAATGTSALRERLSRPLLLLQFVVVLVLLVTCANLANLLLAHSAARGRELSARQALGAPRSRLVRQLFTESLVVSILGGAAAILVAYWTSSALLRFLPPEQAPALVHLRFRPAPALLAFAAGVSLLTCLLFGLIPAIRATRAAASLNRPGAGAGERGRGWMTRSLVAGEVAMCTLLLMVAGLFVRSLVNLRWQDTGYRENGLLVADLEPPREVREAHRDRFYEDLRERVLRLPGVEAAAYSHLGQLSGGGIEYRLQTSAGETHEALEQRVSPGFFAAMGNRLGAGRDFTDRDDAAAPPVAIVNNALARRLFPNADPIGRRFTVERLDRSRVWTAVEIVGVVPNSKWIDLRSESPMMYYRPYAQSAGRPSVRLAVRGSGSLQALAAGVAQSVQSLDRRVAVKNLVPFSDMVDRTLLVERLVAHVSAAFGALAVLIAAVGLYGVLACGVARRRREIGVRIALGASSGSVEWLFLRESFALLSIGFLIGAPAAILIARLVQALLFGLTPVDPLTLGAVFAVLALSTAAAAYLPSRRAAAIDPIQVLREE